MNAPVDPAEFAPLEAATGQVEQSLDAIRGLATLLDSVGGELPSGFELAALINLVGDRLAESFQALERLITVQRAGSSAGALR